MSLSAGEFATGSAAEVKALNRITLKLVRGVVLKSTKLKKRWLANWDRSDLIGDGYSERIVAKAREWDLKENFKISIFFILFYIPSFLSQSYGWAFALFFILIVGYSFYQYRKSKLSFSDNLLVLEEIKQKLGADILERTETPEEHPLLEKWNRRLEHRALLWRVDRFLSRNPSHD